MFEVLFEGTFSLILGAMVSVGIAPTLPVGVPVWFLCSHQRHKCPKNYVFNMSCECLWHASPISQVMKNLPEHEFAHGHLVGLVLLQPIKHFSPLTPLDEIGRSCQFRLVRWQMRSISAAHEAFHRPTDARFSLEIPPADMWQHPGQMQAFKVRESFIK